MSRLSNCPYCQSNVPDRGSYCPHCAKQVKCKQCQEILEKNALACVICGTKIGEGQIAGEKLSYQEIVGKNKIEFQQKGNSKSLIANFSDEVGSYMAATLGHIITDSPFRGKKPFGTRIDVPMKQIGNSIDKPSVDIPDAHIIEEIDVDSVLQTIFSEEDGQIRLTNPRLKHNGKLDQAIRLSILLLYAYKLCGKNKLDRGTISEALSKAKLYDSNFRNWLTKTDYLIVDGNFLELTLPGEECATEILKEIGDPNIEKGRRLNESKTSKGSKKRSAAKSVTQSSSSEAVLDWRHNPDEFGSPKQSWNLTKKAMWLLYVTGKKLEKKELSAYQIAQTFNRHFRESGQIAASNIPRDLGKAKTKAKTLGEDTTRSPSVWYLTETGLKEVEKLVEEAKS